MAGSTWPLPAPSPPPPAPPLAPVTDGRAAGVGGQTLVNNTLPDDASNVTLESPPPASHPIAAPPPPSPPARVVVQKLPLPRAAIIGMSVALLPLSICCVLGGRAMRRRIRIAHEKVAAKELIDAAEARGVAPRRAGSLVNSMRTTSRVMITIFDGLADDALATAVDMSQLMSPRVAGSLRSFRALNMSELYAAIGARDSFRGSPLVGGASPHAEHELFSTAMPDKTLSMLRREMPRLHMEEPPRPSSPSALQSHPLSPAGDTSPWAPPEPVRHPSPTRRTELRAQHDAAEQRSWRRRALEGWSGYRREPPAREPSPKRHLPRISNLMRYIGWSLGQSDPDMLLNEVPTWNLGRTSTHVQMDDAQNDEPSGSAPRRR